MWMPKNQTLPRLTRFGSEDITGAIVSKVDSRPGPRRSMRDMPTEVHLFRLKVDATGQVLSCRFEGPLQAMLDMGDQVAIRGYFRGGVLNATRIVHNGAVVAQAACFVATVVYGDEAAPELVLLRSFRDDILIRSPVGRQFIDCYWRVGPRLARYVAHRPTACRAVRCLFLSPLAALLRRYSRVTNRPFEMTLVPRQIVRKGQNHVRPT